jgi:hypothetical protein
MGGGYDGPPASSTPAASPGTLVDLTTLKILKDKGIITQAELDSAVHDISDSVGSKGAGEANTLVVGKWATTLYGFIEADSIYDTTQSLNDLAGNSQIARGGTYAGSQGRVQFGVRNSRLGLRMKAPEVGSVRTSGNLEMDFLGNQLPAGPNNSAAYTTAGLPTAAGTTGSGSSTEAQFFTNPTMRIRHAYLKVETPIVDFLFGQYWALYGWQQTYAPSTVEIQGLPGQVYSRTPQIRISKSVKNEDVIFELAVAALRPSQRDSAVPNGEAGIRLGTPRWSGLTTGGATGTGIQPLSIAVTGDARSFTLPSYTLANTANASNATSKLGTSIAVDGYIPIIPAKKKQGNALSVTGEFSTGYGNADLYTGLTGGAPNPTLPAAKGALSGASADIDPGLVVYDNLGNIHLVQWTSYIFGLQYYLPGADGNVWLSLNYSNISSNNLQNGFGKATAVRKQETWYDANLFWAATESYRLGLEGAVFADQYVDGVTATNVRVQFSNYFIF